MMVDGETEVYPIGFRFDPSGEEMIGILRRIMSGLPLYPSTPITERDLYGDDPWLVFPEHDPCWVSHSDSDSDTTGGDDHKASSSTTTSTCGRYNQRMMKNQHTKKANKKFIYAFVRVKNASTTSNKNKSRTAGSGTWHGVSGKKEIYDHKCQLVGYYKTFDFRVREKPNVLAGHGHGHWIMYEYCLDGVSLSGITDSGNNNCVLCKICKFDNKSLKFVPPVEEEELGEALPATTAAAIGKGRKRKHSNLLSLPRMKFCTGESSSCSVGIDTEATSELASESGWAIVELPTEACEWDLEDQHQLQELLQMDDNGCSNSAAQILSPPTPFSQTEDPCSFGTSCGDVANQATSERVDDMVQNQVPPSSIMNAEIEVIPPTEQLCYGDSGISNEEFYLGSGSEHMFLNSQDIEGIMGGTNFDTFADIRDTMAGSNFDRFVDDGLPDIPVQPPQSASSGIS